MRFAMSATMPRWALALLYCALGVASSSHAASKVNGPSVYVAKHGSGKVYIFGSCVSGNHSWLTPRLAGALRKSVDFWREIPVGPPLSWEAELNEGRRASGALFDDLTAEQTKRALAWGSRAGLTRDQLGPLKPWLAAQSLSFGYFAKIGDAFGGEEDPEAVMSKQATSEGKPLRAEFQSWQEYLDFFNSMPPPVQTQYLSYTMDTMEKADRSQKTSYAACSRGNIAYFADELSKTREKYPILYEYIEDSRNDRSASRIKELLSEGGVHFVLVGINHTLGEGSIQAHLKRLGIVARRF